MEYGALSKNCLLRLAYTSSAHFYTQVVYNILSPALMIFNICIEHLVVPVKLRLKLLLCICTAQQFEKHNNCLFTS